MINSERDSRPQARTRSVRGAVSPQERCSEGMIHRITEIVLHSASSIIHMFRYRFGIVVAEVVRLPSAFRHGSLTTSATGRLNRV